LSGGPIEDFQTMRGAKHVALAVSSFSWLAAWLSGRVQVIHMPLAGLFNPVQRSDIDLVPRGDSRWRCHRFTAGHFLASDEQKAILTSRYAVQGAGNEQPSFLGYRLEQAM